MPVNLSYPKPREIYTKFISIARTDTTGTEKAKLPKGAILVGAFVLSGTASNAGTTAVISVGTTATSNELVASYDVKTAATGEGFSPVGAAAVGTAFATALTADTSIFGIYAETGTASTTGGPWVVRLDYTFVGPGETITS